MRDSQAFQLQFRIDVHGVAKISLKQLSISASNHIQCQGLVFFDELMGYFFILSEHGLADKGGPDVIDLTVD